MDEARERETTVDALEKKYQKRPFGKHRSLSVTKDAASYLPSLDKDFEPGSSIIFQALSS